MHITWPAIRQAVASRPPRVLDTCSRRAAVAIVLRDGAIGIDVLFIHRAEHPEDPWSGHMAFPGGRAEDGEAPFATAVRETFEEVSLDLAQAESLGALDELQARRRVPVDLAIAPFVFRVSTDAVARPNHEVRSVCWIPLADLVSERLRSTFDYTDAEGLLRFPCFRIEDKVIWGLTYRMFEDLEARLRALASGARR